METLKQVAIFGGTFDPPTLAHEAIIAHCLEDERYDEVWLMPSGNRTDKPGMHSEALRLDLLQTVQREVFGGNPRLKVTDFELTLPRPTETVHTYEALRAAYPGTQFWFVYGADSIATMHTWHRGDYLRHKLSILAVPRAGYTLPPTSEHLRHIHKDRIYGAGMSSTQVRERIAAHKRFQHLVSHAVADQIVCRGLYSR